MAGSGESEVVGSNIVHLVMFPWLAFGHISPFPQLARKLISIDTGIRVTFLTAVGTMPCVEAMLASAAGAVSAISLYLPHVPSLPEGAASTAELPNNPLALVTRAGHYCIS